jgi:hypothetical protein
MEIDRKIKAIIKKYLYVDINKPNLFQKREISSSHILGLRDKSKFRYFYTCRNNSKEFRERMIVFNYFFKLNKSEKEIRDIWFCIRYEKYPLKGIYSRMPNRERKDNAHPELYGINFGSGGENRSSIRVPSKKRKNKWKNFKKLFPKYCEDNNLI